MSNINEIDNIISRLKSDKQKLNNTSDESNLLNIIRIKSSKNSELFSKKTIGILLKKYNWFINDENKIVDGNNNLVSKNTIIKKFSESIKIKLLSYKKLNDGDIENKKSIYTSLLLNVANSIKLDSLYKRRDYVENDTKDNTIKEMEKGMGNF